MSIATEIVRPRDCAFVLTFPTTKADFYDDLNRGSDFLKRYFAGSRLSYEEKWNDYRPVAELASRVVSSLRRYRVNLTLRASSLDCVTALMQNKVTILFAHWRSSDIYDEDVDWPAFTDQLMDYKKGSSPSWVGRIKTGISSPLSAEGKAALLTELNRILCEDSLTDDQQMGDGPVRLAPTRERKMYFNRKRVEKYFPKCIRNGAAVEFASGLTLIEDVADRVSPNFVGLLDLSVCNSILLGEMVKERAPGSLAIGTELPAIVEFRLLLYGSLFGLLKSGRPYLETLTKLRVELVRSFTQEGR